jgi:zeta-carotene desaturase
MLRINDKIAIARAMAVMSRGLPEDSSENFLSWLRRHKQTEQAIERFWKTVLVSALNEDLDRISVRYATQVFRESFMKSATAGRMGLPSIPLSDLYGNAIEYIRIRGGEVLLRSSVTAVGPKQDRVGVLTGSGEQQFDFTVLAPPFQNVASLLPSDESAKPIKQQLAKFEPSSITGIHLWFEREITPLPHAVLLDRTIQWMFHKSKFHESREQAGQGSYVELVVSASKSLVQKSREEILDLATRELAEFFPAAREARLLKAAVIKEIYATYAIFPGLDKYRPEAMTQWSRIFLAGDWIATGWPATMEGAVRSGYLAAEALMKKVAREQKFVVPDLPATGLMKLFW